MQLIQKWCSEYDINVNKKKCGVMEIKKDRRTPSNPFFYLERIELVPFYKYLGIKIADQGGLEEELTTRQVSLKKMNKFKHIMVDPKLDGLSRFHIF